MNETNRVQERILEPERKICDPHHHLWDRSTDPYLLPELLDDLRSGHNIVSTVFVECMSMYRGTGPLPLRPVGETEFVRGIGAMSASGRYGPTQVAAGIVSYADLTLGATVREVLEAHQQAGGDRFCGIRHAAGWDPHEEIKNSHTNPKASLMLDEQFNLGMEVLGEMGLTFDAWFYHHQMKEFVQLAKSHPDVTMILDHLGGPLGTGPYEGKHEEIFRRWQEDISHLIDCKNVYFKLGGINMERNGFGWHLRPQLPDSDELINRTGHYYEFCIQQFGAERCMFESNFPVDKISCSYDVLWNAFKKLTEGYSEIDKSALFHDTAVAAYQLDGRV